MNKKIISGKQLLLILAAFFLIICIFYTVIFINAKLTTKNSTSQIQNTTTITETNKTKE